MTMTSAAAGPTSLGRKEFHVAPMIDVSTVEFRHFIRLLTKRALIWNQMVVAETLVHRSGLPCRSRNSHGRRENSPRELSCSSRGDSGPELTSDLRKYCGWYECPREGESSTPRPTICQIGSNDPEEAAFAVRVAMKCGYDAVDLNCECPSDRVAGRCFGAALMKDWDSAVAVVSSMLKAARSGSRGSHASANDESFPVSVKTRIGVDDDDSYDFIVGFIKSLVDAGCRHFVIHARKVYTEGLSPAQNRDIPPLDYPRVYRLMECFPQCQFVINGGLRSLEHARAVAYGHGTKFDESGKLSESCSSPEGKDVCGVDDDRDHAVPCQFCNLPRGSCLHPRRVAPPNLRGVMVGRLARDRPADLADVDRYFYGETSNPCRSRRELMEKYIEFLERVYPRRCCDDNDAVTLDMVRDGATHIVPKRQCCGVCEDFRGGKDGGDRIIDPEADNGALELARSEGSSSETREPLGAAKRRKQGGKRSKRHAKYGGAKVVTRIIDRSLQPTWGILAGMPGKNAYRRASHELSRCPNVRNCGPGYIVWKAMTVVPDDIWDRPFELSCSGDKMTAYYPTK